ncbi:class I SAM-dependent methyltransferase [Candidatus Margulisiibacteriota bacterium]
MEPEYKKLYSNRFSESEVEAKDKLWKVLCKEYLQQHIDPGSTVVDIGAGQCNFINNIEAKKKIAVDLNDECQKYANGSVEFINSTSSEIEKFNNNSVDVVFMSNFLEHLKNVEEIYKTLNFAYQKIKDKGKVIIIQPNIKYAFKEYWDFFDHFIPLSHKSVSEALMSVGFKLEKVIDRFLPYTTKSSVPKSTELLKLYLSFPLLWKLLGKQMLIIARK